MSDEKFRIKGWQAQALRAAVTYMESRAKIAESIDSLAALGLDFQTHLNTGKAYRCAADDCEVTCFPPQWGDTKDPLRCEAHEKAHNEQVLVKRDADLESGAMKPPDAQPAKPITQDIPF